MSTYVELDMKDFESIFNSLGMSPEIVDDPRAKEYLFKIKTHKKNISVVIYSSLDKSNSKTRGVGEDAIRVVFWDDLNNHPISKGSRRIYRVTSKESVAKRIKITIEKFLLNASTIESRDWDYVSAILKAVGKSGNGFAQSLSESLLKYGRLTENQVVYVIGETTPKGKPTFEQMLKNRGWAYDPTIERDVEEDETLEERRPEPAPEVDPGIEEKSIPRPNKEPQNGQNAYNIEVIKDHPTELVPTTGYSYKFSHFNPVQSLVFPFRGEDVNIIIGASTSAGKTVCAEICMDEVLKKGERVVYLSPLKSLTQEKYDDWKKRYSNYKITILTGDYTLSEEKKNALAQSHIIVMTSEMTDSRTRRMETEKNYWLKEVGLVIVDESHILSTSRGHAVESGIMRFTGINKDARILFLSATMPNVDQLGAWLRLLNGKDTKVIYSTWRPVELQFHYMEYEAYRDKYGRESYAAAQKAKKDLAVHIIKSKPDEKFLVFTHDKGTGNSLVKLLEEEGIQSSFHNADLDLDERLEKEQDFNKREGGLRVLVSTSTLAWGRNLPARNVIVVGVHRGIQEVDQLDIIQMSGRAGRYGIDPEGHVYLILPQGTTGAWKEIFKNPRPVMSTLNNHHILAFHVLAEVQNRVITDTKTFQKWYARSLAYFQGLEFGLDDCAGLLNDLVKMEMLADRGSYFALTGLGRVSSWLYYSPYDVYGWFKNFKQIFGMTEVDDLSLAWALTDIPTNDWGYIPKEVAGEADEVAWKLRNRGIQPSPAVHVSLAAYKCLRGEDLGAGTLKATARGLRYDMRRINQALELIDSMYAKWEKKELWKIFPTRIQYGIPEEMVELVKIPGIGGVKARKMWDKGIRSLSDVLEKPEAMKALFTPTTIKKIQNDVRNIKQYDRG